MALVGFGLGRLNHAIEMLGRAVQRVKLERGAAAVHDVVARSCGNDYSGPVSDRIFLAINHDHSLAFLETEELVAIFVDLRANLVARLERHQHQLKLLAGVQHAAEISVGNGLLLNIVAISALHHTLLI